MKSRDYKQAGVAIAFAVFLIGTAGDSVRASDLGQFLGRRIVRVDVEVEGAPERAAAEMRDAIEISAGQDYAQARIHDSLVRLHRLGLVAGARVEAEPVGADGVALKFIVKPQPRIADVVFEGDSVFPENVLRARLNQLDPGQKLSPGAISRGLTELQAFYTDRGYYQAAITAATRLDPTGTRATVEYTIMPGEQARVSSFSLNVKGAKIDLADIAHAVAEGAPFRQSDVRDEMDRIRESYLSRDYLAVRTTGVAKPDIATNTVAVTIDVESGPKIDVDVRGLDLSTERKKEILPFYTQGGVDDFMLEEARRRLLDYAQRKGHFFAEVTKPDPPDLSKETVRLEYAVETGRRYKLTDIDITGLDAIPRAEIESELRTRKSSVFPFFGFGRGLTSNEMLRRDVNLIQRRLREVGYRKADVDVLRGVSVEGDNLIITFEVKQGPRTHVQELAVRGNTLMTETELLDRVTLKPADPLDSRFVNQGTEQILQPYFGAGYAAAQAVPEIIELPPAGEQERVRLVYSLTEGHRVRILHIYTRGLADTDEGRLKRNFYLFKEGEWLNNDKLLETEQVLYDTTAFSAVTVRSEPVSQPLAGIEERNVTVDIAEAKRYLLIYGFGYKSTRDRPTLPGQDFLNGARALVQLTNTNLFGKLYTGSAQFRVAEDELLGTLSFQDPRPFGLKSPLVWSVFAQRLAQRSFSSDRYSTLLQLEKPLSDTEIVYANYNFERISVFDLKVSASEIERNRRSITIGRVGASYARNSRDNAFDPTRGTFTTGNVSLAATALGGDEQFLKFLVQHDRFHRLPKLSDVVYSFSVRFGLAAPFGPSSPCEPAANPAEPCRDDVHISQRFFAGGALDLRGFGFEEAGPRDEVTGEPVGGNAVLIINNELRFPLWGGLGGVVFSDTGNVFRRVRDIQPGALTESIGFGLRIKTPLGPFRFDLGFLVANKPEGASSSRFHISFGQTF